MIQFEVREPDPVCGAPSSSRKTAMHCELPLGHHIPGTHFGPEHYGRNRLGKWRTWAPRPEEKKLTSRRA